MAPQARDANGNRFLGDITLAPGAQVEFRGRDNLVVADGPVTLHGRVSLTGDDGLVHLTGGLVRLAAGIHSGCTLHVGRSSFFNGVMHVSVSERSAVYLGDDGLFSFGIWIRTSDVHLLYSVSDRRRLNPAADVFVGDHVWLGQDSMLLKGTVVGSGAVIGARTLLTGKTVPSNTSWAGSPGRQLASGIFFTGESTHAWDAEQSAAGAVFADDADAHVFGRTSEAPLRAEAVLAELRSCGAAEARLAYLRSLPGHHDRFHIPLPH